MVTVMVTVMAMKNNPVSKAGNFCLIVASLVACPAYSQQAISGSALSNNSASSPVASTDSNELDARSSQAIVVKPRITLTETWSDNIKVSRNQNGKESGLITELAPGIRIEAKTARLKTYFDYALREQFYSTSSANNRTQNSLNTFGTLEAVSNWLFLDFSGRIAQQAISAFGPQSSGNTSINSNSTETSMYRISPFIRGNLAGAVDYSLRYNRSTTQSSASNVSNVDLSEWIGQLYGGTPFRNIKWSVDATQQTADYSLGRITESKRLSAMGTFTIVPQFRLSLSGGRESNNYASAEMESHPTHGYGFDWNPTERTQVSAFRERRFFGNAHRYSASHRFPLSSIRYTDTRNVSVLPNQFSSIGLGTIFDLVYQICSQQLASTIADPAQLDHEANICANNWIVQAGISPDTQVTSSFLSSRATIQRSQQLALALQGVRNTLTLLFIRGENQSLLASSAVNDDFLLNNTNSIRQRGISVNLSHQLSAISRLNMMISRQESTSTGVSAQKVTSMMYQGNLTTKLGSRTNGGISIRHTEFDSAANPYTENALIGTLSVIF